MARITCVLRHFTALEPYTPSFLELILVPTDTPRVTVCLRFDFAALALWIAKGQTTPAQLSRGQFGATAVPHLLDLMAGFGMTASFSAPGHSVLAYPDLVRQIHDAGHELVHQGWALENVRDLELADERRNMDRGFEAFEKVVGVRPRGYASGSDHSEHTLDLLLEYGFDYDSSLMGHDIHPYYLRRGDKVSATEAFEFGCPIDMVEIPVAHNSDDLPQFEFVYGTTYGLSAPSAVEEIWCGDFDHARQQAERDGESGVFVLVMHPQVIGRGHRLLMLERVLEYMSGHDDVTFETLGGYASRWRSANPMARWADANPEKAMAGLRGACEITNPRTWPDVPATPRQ